MDHPNGLFNEYLEVLPLSPRTLENLAQRTDLSREKLMTIMRDANRNHRMVFIAVFKIEKLS